MALGLGLLLGSCIFFVFFSSMGLLPSSLSALTLVLVPASVKARPSINSSLLWIFEIEAGGCLKSKDRIDVKEDANDSCCPIYFFFLGSGFDYSLAVDL